MELEAIGAVRSPVKEPVDTGWGEVVAEIELRADLAAGLAGLEGFSHLLVVFHMHQASFAPARDLQRRPQGRDDMPLTGIFAQRARHRPNHIGITAVRLLSVAGAVVRVQGLDAVDGTPVLDLKPYFPAFDLAITATVPEWAERLMGDYF